ncbi:MAG: NAD-dependent epimerase/dehydratase family protein [bacterium]
MNLSLPSVLITGANGFVGTRLCLRLLGEGYRVTAGVRRTSDLTSLARMDLEYRYGDINDPNSLGEMVTGVDYIVHNAGLTKARHPDDFTRVNVEGTKSLMAAVKAHNPQLKRLVYVSSVAATGPSEPHQARSEADQPQPITQYGRSKLAGEQAALAYSRDFPVTAIRPPGVYGPGDREIFSFFQTVYRGLKPLIGDPNRRLNLVHVDDLCRGLALALADKETSGEVFHIAEDRAYSMIELVTLLQQGCGRRAFNLKLPGGLFRLIAAVSEGVFKLFGRTPMLTREKADELLASWEVSVEKAHELLGYRSRIPFAQGAVETYQWYLKNGWL